MERRNRSCEEVTIVGIVTAQNPGDFIRKRPSLHEGDLTLVVPHRMRDAKLF
jgi:hypothetical protein